MEGATSVKEGNSRGKAEASLREMESRLEEEEWREVEDWAVVDEGRGRVRVGATGAEPDGRSWTTLVANVKGSSSIEGAECEVYDARRCATGALEDGKSVSCCGQFGRREPTTHPAPRGDGMYDSFALSI